MRKIVLFCFLFAIFFTAKGQIQWNSITAASTSDIKDKYYIVDFYTSWCGYCKKMDRETFTDATVAKIINKYYYPVKFNAEGSESFSWNGYKYSLPSGSGRKVHQFASGVLGQQMGFPSFAIFNSNRQLIQVIPGYYPPKDFAIILWYFASGDNKKYTYPQYIEIFEQTIRPQMEKQIK